MRRRASLLPLLLLIASTRQADAADTAAAEPTTAVLAPADAAAREGEECTVEFTVAGARKLPGKQICFLNSCRDHRDEKNFTVVIFKAGLDRLKADGIDDPAEHFIDATIRVRGVVEKRDGRPQIVVEEPGQLVVTKPAEQAAAPAE